MHMKRWGRWVFVVVCIISLFGVVPEGRADSQTFNALFFQPAIGRNPYLMLQGTETLKQLQFDAGEIFSYGYRPLEMRQAGTRIQGVIDQTVVADFVAAFGAMDWLQLGIDFPLILINKFRNPLVTPAPAMANHFDIGDIRFEVKARFLDACEKYVGVAIVPFVTIPTGKSSHYVGDPGITGGARVVVDGRPHPRIGLTLNVGYKGGKKVNVRNIEYQHLLLLGLGVNGQLGHGVDIFVEANAEAAFNKLFADKDMNPAEVMVGARWDIKQTGVSIHGGGGTCLVCGVKGARVRAVLGAKYRFMNENLRMQEMESAKLCKARFAAFNQFEMEELRRKCPPDPSLYQAGVSDPGCPKYYEMRELADLVIRCPSDPAQFNPQFHDAGCPKIFNLAETYTRDEIWSIYSMSAAEMGIRCPADPAQFNASLHDFGCPKYYDLKEVVTLAERCPENPGAYRAGVDDAACPKYYTLRDEYNPDQWALIAKLSKIDSDNDGINDYLDRCPKEPEDFNGFADHDGCPEGGQATVAGGEIATLRPVYFQFGSAVLSSEAKAIVDQVIQVINATPWVRRVRVSGNTDDIGNWENNERLSRKRSGVVIDYMRQQGTRSDVELVPIAYGSARPAASNKTEQGRALNRRVIFNVASVRYPTFTPPTPTLPATAPAAAPPDMAPLSGTPVGYSGGSSTRDLPVDWSKAPPESRTQGVAPPAPAYTPPPAPAPMPQVAPPPPIMTPPPPMVPVTPEQAPRLPGEEPAPKETPQSQQDRWL